MIQLSLLAMLILVLVAIHTLLYRGIAPTPQFVCPYKLVYFLVGVVIIETYIWIYDKIRRQRYRYIYRDIDTEI